MLVTIQHTVNVSYPSSVFESAVDLMLTPRIDAHQTMRGFDLLVGPDVPVFDYVDWQGNCVHHFSIALPHDRLAIWANATV